MQLFIRILLSIIPVLAQECRLSAITPAQSANRVEEGERATESQTFQTNALAVSPGNRVHFFDATFRIRRIEANGRLTTVAGNGQRDEAVEGPALQSPLQNVIQIAFSPVGVLHFVSGGRVLRVVDGRIETAAGTGRPGFNGEDGRAVEINLGTIVNVAFAQTGELYLIDAFNRVRVVTPDGALRTFAGGPRVSVAAGRVGDDGPATEAALSNPRQLFVLPDGLLWIKDLAGRHLRTVDGAGVIRTINPNFDATINFIALSNGQPAAATANRVFPFNSRGDVDSGSRPFVPFTGTPLAVGPDNALYYLGGARPEQRNPLVRLSGTSDSVVAGAPVAALVDGQAPPFGIWNARAGSLIYSASVGGKSGILEARPGQQPRFTAGGGTETNDAEGKSVTDLTIYGIAAFTIDGEGRLIIADVFRRRILVVGSDGKVSILKTQGGAQVVFAPIGTFSTLQRITADNAGNIYWFLDGAAPTGGVFTATVAVWIRSSQSVSTFTVPGLAGLTRMEDGTAVAISGNSATFRRIDRLTPTGLGEPVTELENLPLVSVTRLGTQPYFVAASRLFRGAPGKIEYFNEPFLPTGAAIVPDFTIASASNVMIHSSDGGFYRIDNIDACRWMPQPVATPASVVNAASFADAGVMAPRQLLTIFGSGIGPVEGQGVLLDGLLRVTTQAAPFPGLTLGNFSGAIPNATLTGTNMPVLYSSDRQVTVQAPAALPAGNTFLLYYGWQGLTLIAPGTVRTQPTSPGIFYRAVFNEDGSRNGQSNPAAAGSVVQLFATGLGAIDPTLPLGEYHPTATLTRTTGEVTITAGGRDAEVLFAGGAPGLPGGVYQVNFRIPEGVGSGARPIELTIGGESTATRQAVAVYVK